MTFQANVDFLFRQSLARASSLSRRDYRGHGAPLGVVVRWKKLSKANQKKTAKIEVQYSTDKRFRNGVRTVSAKKTASSKNIKKLKSGKTYYLRVRAIRQDGSVLHVSGWSAGKKVRVK